jgi:hypothetical protein
VRFLDRALATGATRVAARLTGAPFAHLAVLIDRDLPGFSGTSVMRPSPGAQLPGQPSRWAGNLAGKPARPSAIRSWLAPAPSQVTISRRRNAGGTFNDCRTAQITLRREFSGLRHHRPGGSGAPSAAARCGYRGDPLPVSPRCFRTGLSALPGQPF